MILNSGTDLILRGGDVIMDNTLGRLGVPMADEDKSRVYLETTTGVLSKTTGVDLGNQERLAKLEAIEDQLNQYGQLSRQQKAGVGKQLLKDMSNPDTFVVEKEEEEEDTRPKWHWVLFFIVNLFMFLGNWGLYNNEEVAKYLNKNEEEN